MPRNEEGEFELVVGTRQLLTVVFILMVLFGVVFSMGYFVGRNVAGESPLAAAAAKPPANPVPDSARVTSAPPSPVGDPVPAPAPGQVAANPAAAPLVEPAKPPAAAPTLVAEPAAGQTFLQVAAVKRPEAELIVEVLKKKGFPAITAPVPNESLFRVLVGPLADNAAVTKTKTDLELAGFRSIVRKY